MRSLDRINTSMRVEASINNVECLRGLAALHYAMRQHGCSYVSILTEIELVIARNGSDNTLVTSVPSKLILSSLLLLVRMTTKRMSMSSLPALLFGALLRWQAWMPRLLAQNGVAL